MSDMKIKSISINGYKAIRSFTLDPDGKSIQISGPNGAGKSSLIEACWVALTQKEIPGVPIHREAVKANIRLGLTSGHVVTWTKTQNSTTLKITDPDGVALTTKPAETLRNLIGDISFDPFTFSKATPAEQKATLQRLMGLEFGDLDGAKRTALDKAKAAKGARDAIERQLDGMAAVVETKAVPLDELLAEQATQQELRDKRTQWAQKFDGFCREEEKAGATIEQSEAEIRGLEARILTLRSEVEAATTYRAELQSRIAKGTDALKALDERIAELPDIAEKIRNSSAVNEQASKWARKLELRKEYEEAGVRLEAADMEVQAVEQARLDRIAAAEFPVDGLEFGEDGLLFRGLPFDEKNQCKSDIIKVGVAIAISQNPNLKICKIKDGSLLDPKSKKAMLDLLHAHGFQCLIEEVSHTSDELEAVLIEADEE